MKVLSYLSFILITSFFISLNAYSQKLSTEQKEIITSEIVTVFEKSIKSGENFELKMMTENIDDSMQAGFISDGLFYQSFNSLLKDYEENIKGCLSQKMNVINKKISILADNAALVTASGDYSIALEDGRTLTGKFVWTLVYSKVNENWKIIHSHM